MGSCQASNCCDQPAGLLSSTASNFLVTKYNLRTQKSMKRVEIEYRDRVIRSSLKSPKKVTTKRQEKKGEKDDNQETYVTIVFNSGAVYEGDVQPGPVPIRAGRGCQKWPDGTK